MRYIIEGTRVGKDARELDIEVEIDGEGDENEILLEFKGVGFFSLAELKRLVKNAEEYTIPDEP